MSTSTGWDIDQQNALITAMERIAHGGFEAPTGFEALVMSIAGPGTPGDRNLLDGLEAIAESNLEIAKALNNLAEAVKHHGEAS